VAGSLARFLLRESAPSRAARRAITPRSPRHAPHRNVPCITAMGELTAPLATRQARRSVGERSQEPGRNAAHCPGRAPPASTVLRVRAARGRAFGAPLTLETSADPAGQTPRARPEARPEARAANLASKK
jgi:hypothetical protein